MDPLPGTANGSGPFSDSGDWREPRMLNKMSISELIAELRDTFRSSDFDRVEETLVAREARLKAEIEEKENKIGVLQKKFQLERLDKINAELELKRVKQETGKNVKAELGCESGKLEGLKKEGVVAEVKVERVEPLVETKKIRDGKPSKKDDLGASAGGRFAMENVIDIEDSDEEMYNSQGTLHRKETTSCTIANYKHLGSSGAVQKNLATRLVKSNGVLKREFSASNEFDTDINMEKILNILDGLDSDSSSSCSSSSSGSLDIDSLPLSSAISNKKMRTDAASLGLNS